MSCGGEAVCERAFWISSAMWSREVLNIIGKLVDGGLEVPCGKFLV